MTIHYLLSFTHEEYGRVTSLKNIASHLRSDSEISKENSKIPLDYFIPEGVKNDTLLYDRRANATFVVLARNSDADGAVRSIHEMEDRFNRHYKYPYVLLNEEPFTYEFKKCVLLSLVHAQPIYDSLTRRISVLTTAKVEFGVIPREHWYQPDWIDEKKATASRNKMVAEDIIYGGSFLAFDYPWY